MERTLLSILLGLLPFACVMGFLVVGGGLLVLLFARGAGRTARQFAQRPEATGEAFLAAAKLAPWQPEALGDLAAAWEGWWRDVTALGRQESYAQGVVQSLANPGGPGWLAFTLERRQFRNATVVLRASDRRVVLSVAGGGALDPNVRGEATIDGQGHGTLAVTYPRVVYRTAAGAEAHWVAEVRWNSDRYAGGRLLSREVRYDPVTYNGSPVGALTDTWVRYPHPDRSRPFPPAWQALALPLTPPEQEVMLVALALGLYYDDLRKRKYIYDW